MAPARSDSRLAAAPPRTRGPCIDGFGTCISAVVLVAAVLAAFVVRQNLDDHGLSVAANTPQVETSGAAASR